MVGGRHSDDGGQGESEHDAQRRRHESRDKEGVVEELGPESGRPGVIEVDGGRQRRVGGQDEQR